MQTQRQYGSSNVIRVRNYTDDDGNPAGGYAHGPGMCIAWQDGPRKLPDGTLDVANGAFVEDDLLAAMQRLEFFQDSKFKHEANARAIDHIRSALDALWERSSNRAERGVLGTHTA